MTAAALVESLLAEEQELISPKDIEWWSRYTKNRGWETEEAAREWIFGTLQHHDRQTVIGAANGEEKNRAIAAAMPIYELKTGKKNRFTRKVEKFKIGRPVRDASKRFSWDDLEIRSNSTHTLYHTAEANGLTNYEYKRKQLVRIDQLGDLEGYDNSGEENRIAVLAEKIKEGGWFECVIVAVETDGSMWLVEGQHRSRAVQRHFKFKTIYADLIVQR